MQISSFNKRNKERLATTISNIYSVDSNQKYINEAILDRLLWVATENNDVGRKIKYIGQPYWSTGAIKQLEVNKRNSKYYNYNLRHEHAVPKKLIRELILKGDKSQLSIFAILDKFAHSVIVSKDEDQLLNKYGLRSKMPKQLEDSYDFSNIFSRYIEVGIDIYNIGENDPRLIAANDLINYKKLTFRE